MGGGHLLLRRGSAARLVWRPPSPSTAPGKNAWWCGTRQAKRQRIAKMSLLLWLRVKKKKTRRSDLYNLSHGEQEFICVAAAG